MNAKHLKKLTEIEDFVTILPTSAESYERPVDKTWDPKISRSDLLNPDLPEDRQEILALMDDPSRRNLSIESSAKQSAPLIATLESNVDKSKQTASQGQAYDGSTFITNMIDEPAQEEVMLPEIATSKALKERESQWAKEPLKVNGYRKHKNSGLSQSREYQLVPAGASQDDRNDSQDYHASSNQLVKRNDLARKQVDIKHQSLTVLPRSRTRLQREPSELSFQAGKRLAVDSKAGARILGESSGYCHSTLRSAMGRESRILQKLHQRVGNF